MSHQCRNCGVAYPTRYAWQHHGCETPGPVRERNRVPWPWLRVLDRGEGDGYAYDFCSPACLAKWARRLVREHTQNEARHADH